MYVCNLSIHPNTRLSNVFENSFCFREIRIDLKSDLVLCRNFIYRNVVNEPQFPFESFESEISVVSNLVRGLVLL